ncbi:MAG TPA: hypothetical protein VFS23_29450 [Vicinamibacterales bacterium]|nr:hypothetical protein [Vicinamibacterales bacterium]
MTQPALGLLSSTIVMVLALGFISLFDFGTFAGWVAFVMLGLIPMQVVAVVLWGANPGFASGLNQPAKGVVLVLVTVVATAVLSPIVFMTVGEGVSPPGPIPSHFAVIVVPTTFWLTIMMGGWPFTKMTSNALVSGLLALIASYVITYIVFLVFFNYGFLQGAPVFLPSAPMGMFNAVSALVFYVTALAVMFLVLCFDLWPLTAVPGIMKQPMLGLVWTVIALVGAAVAMWIGVDSGGADPMAFLTEVTAPFIFGSIIVLNMLQNSLFGRMTQPLKGVMNTIAAAGIGLVLAHLYVSLLPMVTGALPSGPPGYEQQIWLANALLSVTFPFLIYHAVFFGYWPLVRTKN